MNPGPKLSTGPELTPYGILYQVKPNNSKPKKEESGGGGGRGWRGVSVFLPNEWPSLHVTNSIIAIFANIQLKSSIFKQMLYLKPNQFDKIALKI